VLPVQSVLDVAVFVDLVHHLVCVLLESGSEDDDLIVLGHEFDELDAARTNQKEAVWPVVHVVDQGLVQIEHQGVGRVLLVVRQRRQEGRSHLRQVREVIWEHGLLGGGDG